MEKLVRDKIPEIIRDNGGDPVVRQVSGDEATKFAKLKLQEELDEVLEAQTREQQIEELADLDEAIQHLKDTLGISSSEVDSARADKLQQRGGFSLNIVLIQNEL